MRTIQSQSPDMIIPRHVAQFAGIDVYRTGKPCHNGHKAFKYVVNYGCLECKLVGEITVRMRKGVPLRRGRGRKYWTIGKAGRVDIGVIERMVADGVVIIRNKEARLP